jgi:hypothetical protein
MTTTSLPRGRGSIIRASYQSALATAMTTSFSELNTYGHDFQKSRPLGDDDILGAGFANSVDARPAVPDVEDAKGSLLVPLDISQIGFWLGAAMGRVSATGTTPKSHVFSSGGLTLPSMTLERQLISGQFEEMVGAVVTGITFPFGAGAGYHQVGIDLAGVKIIEPYSSTLAGSPTVEALANRVPKGVGVIKVATTQIGSIISGSCKLTNSVDWDRYVGDSNFPSLAALTKQDVDFNLTARYNTDALRAYGSLGSNLLPTAQQFDIEYTLSASLKLTLTAKNVRCEPVNVPVQNGGTMTVGIKGRAEVDASNAMLTATLLNSHATY